MGNPRGPHEEMPAPAAFCAPGRKDVSSIALALLGQPVCEIREHAWLAGTTDVLLVAPAEEITIELPEWSTVLPHCGICDGILPYHGPLCLARAYALFSLRQPASLLAGLTV